MPDGDTSTDHPSFLTMPPFSFVPAFLLDWLRLGVTLQPGICSRLWNNCQYLYGPSDIVEDPDVINAQSILRAGHAAQPLNPTPTRLRRFMTQMSFKCVPHHRARPRGQRSEILYRLGRKNDLVSHSGQNVARINAVGKSSFLSAGAQPQPHVDVDGIAIVGNESGSLVEPRRVVPVRLGGDDSLRNALMNPKCSPRPSRMIARAQSWSAGTNGRMGIGGAPSVCHGGPAVVYDASSRRWICWARSSIRVLSCCLASVSRVFCSSSKRICAD